ncbi:Meiotic recombination protein SPO11 [Psilocybe cubensis]|uniref:Meiotic recombination protein SPO11 n=1 Tax=Psilocybe cubensis TaxID=181762 RepID=A0ACB8HAC5_PSICU|nr:Meiotic recombination protein SPO11 [Psilocybe cubensis]KAH9484960.1 Meiotic recombination protein SPO11 [Psilocybe cubensis]
MRTSYGTESPDIDIFMDSSSDGFELDFELEPENSFQFPSSNPVDVDLEVLNYPSDYVEELLVVDDDDDADYTELKIQGEEHEEDLSDDCSDIESSPVIARIEDMVLSFLNQLAFPGKRKDDDELSDRSDPTEKTLSRSDYKITIPLVDRTKSQVDGIPVMKRIQFPKRNKQGSSQALAQLFRVLDLAHEATLKGVPVTKRDIYYQDVSLFKKQKTVDTLVDDLAATFELARSDLNIRSSSKGLVCGSGLRITLITGEVIVCHDSEGSLIPHGEDIETFGLDEDVTWILVVEKEAIFQTLCRLQLPSHESMPGKGIIITGKGYPDVATRHLVKSLADALSKRIPILALMDADPFGLDILSVYKFGSRTMQHENGKLAAKRTRWLGIWASELQSLNIDKEHLLPITRHDEKKGI